MDSPVTKLMFIAAAIAAAALVVAVMWRTLSDNAPQADSTNVDYSRIDSENLCAAVTGDATKWDGNGCKP